MNDLSTNGTLNLLDIPTVVYTCANAGGIVRQLRVTELLNGLGFTNWRFFHGAIGTPYWEIIRYDHAKMLREFDPPFLYLEDDIAVREFRSCISPPPQSQIVYLGGGGAWRRSPLVREAQLRLPNHRIYRVHDIGWEYVDGFNDWGRIYGMFGTHALMYLDKRVMLEVADLMESWRCPPDVTLGANQWKWYCSLPVVPLFFQDDGHNNYWTYHYAPSRERRHGGRSSRAWVTPEPSTLTARDAAIAHRRGVIAARRR